MKRQQFKKIVDYEPVSFSSEMKTHLYTFAILSFIDGLIGYKIPFAVSFLILVIITFLCNVVIGKRKVYWEKIKNK